MMWKDPYHDLRGSSVNYPLKIENMAWWRQNSYLMVFLTSFAVLTFYLTPNVNTGDAGELITAAHYLAIAHPSGYPLYLLIAKAFTLIPFGNIAFRVALVSVVFSALSLVLVFWSILKLTKSYGASICGIALLFCSPSYVTQSVIAKFYPLNLFLILSVYSLWLHRLTASPPPDGPDENTLLPFQLTSFLLGLICATHHTGLLIIPPVAILLMLWRRDLLPRHGRPLLVAGNLLGLFLMGFALNLYLILRGGWGHFGNVFHVTSLPEFWSMVSRQPYGKIGTLALAGKGILDPTSYWNGFLNFMLILKKNFGLPSLLLFTPGAIGLFRRNPRAATLTATALLLYGPLLAKLCLPAREVAQFDYYIYAHQFFLPALVFYAIVVGFGFSLILEQVATMTPRVNHLLPWCFNGGIITLALLARGTDSNFASNHVPFETATDTYSTLPINSVLISYGDNEKFQGRYLKLVGRYRDDVCLLNAVTLQGKTDGIESCATKSYGSISPNTFAAQLGVLDRVVASAGLYTDFSRADKFPLHDYFSTVPLGLAYQVVPRFTDTMHAAPARGNDLTWRLAEFKIVQGGIACEEHSVDDLFTDYLCEKYQPLFSRLREGQQGADETTGRAHKRPGEEK